MPPKSRGGKANAAKDQKLPEPDIPTNIKSKGKGTSGKEAVVGAVDPSNVAEGSKKPDTRTLISGSLSWTGKLPMNLLSEHCQKNKWEKPEYSMVKINTILPGQIRLTE